MKKYKVYQKNGWWKVVNEGGAVLGVSDMDMIIEQDGYAFRDLNHNKTIEPYEDWRLPMEERITDLISRMEVDEMAGLMLYSVQQTVSKNDPFAYLQHYGSSPQDESKMAWDLSESLKAVIEKQKMRHITLSMAESAEAAIRWSNNLQAFAEEQPLGIPVNVATDPRNAPSLKLTEFTMGASDYISTWPDNLAMAATFSPETAKEFGKAASREFRAMGIATTLAPQADLASEPRWNRFYGTFGESSALSADMARAYCDGFQTSEGEAEIADGWGYHSVNTMVKHWPGGGPLEGGRDAHFAYGKYAVYPGDNFAEHLIPFTEGAFRLDGPTKTASAVMPYYSISYGQDKKYGENVEILTANI